MKLRAGLILTVVVFYSDLPPLSVRALSDRQHNALISAGVVLRF
jgi:hypothetical protein